MAKDDNLSQVHKLAAVPEDADKVALVSGEYDYYHYLCDGTDDRGWGCGYRTLQTVISWITLKHGKGTVPSIREIQECLVKVGDKEANFIGSKDWLGSVEVSITIDSLCDVPCRILHVRSGELPSLFDQIFLHFTKTGCPIMMGGDRDASSKGVFGACRTNAQSFLLIVDPHYVSPTGSSSVSSHLASEGWVKWVPLDHFNLDSFYNLCLPQVNN